MSDRMLKIDEKENRYELCDDTVFQGTLKLDDDKTKPYVNDDIHADDVSLCANTSFKEPKAYKAYKNEPNLGYMRGIRITSYLGKWPVKLN